MRAARRRCTIAAMSTRSETASDGYGGCTSQQSKDFDVVVVGASLAGCATATLLGRAGLRVALVDKHADEDAYKRLCGHYIQASATPVIARLGLAGPIEAAGGVRNGADLWTRWGAIVSPEPEGERPYGYNIRRKKLDPMIRRTAIETPGVEYLPRLEATRVLGDGAAVTGVELCDRSRRPMRIGARLVGRRRRAQLHDRPAGQSARAPLGQPALLLHGVFHRRRATAGIPRPRLGAGS